MVATITKEAFATKQGRDYLFRLAKFTLGEQSDAKILLARGAGRLCQGYSKAAVHWTDHRNCCRRCIYSGVWIFGSGMSRSLKEHNGSGRAGFRMLAAPDPSPVTSRIKEIHELGSTVNLAQRAIWSFARFVPKEIVRRSHRQFDIH